MSGALDMMQLNCVKKGFGYDGIFGLKSLSWTFFFCKATSKTKGFHPELHNIVCEYNGMQVPIV